MKVNTIRRDVQVNNQFLGFGGPLKSEWVVDSWEI